MKETELNNRIMQKFAKTRLLIRRQNTPENMYLNCFDCFHIFGCWKALKKSKLFFAKRMMTTETNGFDKTGSIRF